jgi:hypothetical protein
MASISGGDKLEKALAEMAANVTKPGTLQVGFLSNAKYPDGTYVALIAAIQNFGAPAAGIPPRPFFSNMVAAKKAGWPAQIALNLKAQKYDATKALVKVGEGIAGQLRESIQQTNSPPLKAATIKRKGGTKTSAKPLIDSGVMYGSVDSIVK